MKCKTKIIKDLHIGYKKDQPIRLLCVVQEVLGSDPIHTWASFGLLHCGNAPAQTYLVEILSLIIGLGRLCCSQTGSQFGMEFG